MKNLSLDQSIFGFMGSNLTVFVHKRYCAYLSCAKHFIQMLPALQLLYYSPQLVWITSKRYNLLFGFQKNLTEELKDQAFFVAKKADFCLISFFYFSSQCIRLFQVCQGQGTHIEWSDVYSAAKETYLLYSKSLKVFPLIEGCLYFETSTVIITSYYGRSLNFQQSNLCDT